MATALDPGQLYSVGPCPCPSAFLCRWQAFVCSILLLFWTTPAVCRHHAVPCEARRGHVHPPWEAYLQCDVVLLAYCPCRLGSSL